MRSWAAMLTLMLAATAAPMATPAASEGRDRWEKSYPIARRATLRLRTDDGDVRLHAWDRHAITARVSTVGWRIGEGDVRIVERQVGDAVELEVRTPRFEFHFGFLVRALHIDVWVPAEADLNVESGDGDISVPAVAGRLSVFSGDGRIAIDGARGALTLRSGDGRIVATGLDGTLEAATVDGGMRIEGRFDGLTLSSGDGAITAEVRPGSRLATPWSMRTGDGGLTLRVASDLRAELDARTGDGSIDIGMPVTLSGPAGRHGVRGALNGGGPTLTLRSGDGSIRVEGW